MCSNGKCKSKARLDDVTAIITGCNTGIGKETVEDFYKRGARVIMACRDKNKAQEAADLVITHCEKLRRKSSKKPMGKFGDIIIKRLDLCSLASVHAFAEDILQTENKVQLLINNAGIMACPHGKTDEGFEIQFGVNHVAHFLLTLLLLPKLIDSVPSRIVNVSSLAHSQGGQIDFEDIHFERREYSPTAAYQQSKLANILFTKELAKRLQNVPGVNVYSLHPGVVATDVSRHLDTAFFPGVRCTYDLFGRMFAKTPLQGAQTTIYCAIDEKCAQETGLYYSDCKVKKTSKEALDEFAADKLWEMSLGMVGFTSDPFPIST